jgi:hypothetical protein
MLVASFISKTNHTKERNLLRIKVDGLAAGVRKVGLVLLILAWSWHSICKSSQPMRKKGLAADKIS